MLKYITRFVITFILFTIEAFLHINIGKSKYVINGDFDVPTHDELVNVMTVITFFALLNSLIINELHKLLGIY